jgi:hypothetical protein
VNIITSTCHEDEVIKNTEKGYVINKMSLTKTDFDKIKKNKSTYNEDEFKNVLKTKYLATYNLIVNSNKKIKFRGGNSIQTFMLTEWCS